MRQMRLIPLGGRGERMSEKYARSGVIEGLRQAGRLADFLLLRATLRSRGSLPSPPMLRRSVFVKFGPNACPVRYLLPEIRLGMCTKGLRLYC
jgi:hypothetical protein